MHCDISSIHARQRGAERGHYDKESLFYLVVRWCRFAGCTLEQGKEHCEGTTACIVVIAIEGVLPPTCDCNLFMVKKVVRYEGGGYQKLAVPLKNLWLPPCLMLVLDYLLVMYNNAP